MKCLPLIAVAGLAVVSESQVSAEDFSAQDVVVKTHSEYGGNSATIIQSGGPGKAKVRVIRKPGYTSVEQHSDGSSAIIIQTDGDR